MTLAAFPSAISDEAVTLALQAMLPGPAYASRLQNRKGKRRKPIVRFIVHYLMQ
jgi:hypothetical protein